MPPGKQTNEAPFSIVKPSEVLYTFDGPRIFTFLNRDGATFLAYFCDDVPGIFRFIIVPITPQVVQQLKAGALALRDVLVQPLVWMADLDGSGNPALVWELPGKDLPGDVLPQVGITLLPDSISSPAAVPGGVPQPFDVHLGSLKEGMQVSLRWTGSVSGEILLWLDNFLVWGEPVVEQSRPAICDPPHLLAFLTRGWHQLFFEELYPTLARLNPPNHPGHLRQNVLNVWRSNSAMQEALQEEGRSFTSFLKTHLLARCSKPALFSLTTQNEEYCSPKDRRDDDDSILFLRQGAVMLAATPDHCFYLPLKNCKQILEGLGDAICDRLQSLPATSNPFGSLIQNWKKRHDSVSIFDNRDLASGLSPDRLNQVWPHIGSIANDLEMEEREESLRLAARMVGNLSNDAQLKNLLHQLHTVHRINRQKLSNLQEALRLTGLLGNVRDFQRLDFREHGRAVARWLRKAQNLTHDTQADPEAILGAWGVNCEILTSAIPFDAVAVWGKTLGPVVFLNSKGPRYKYPTGRRFTLAHEIGHLLMDMADYLPFGDVKIGNHEELYVFKGLEIRANAFAAELLIPEISANSWLVRYDEDNRDRKWKNKTNKVKYALKSIASHFNVSHELAAWKIKHTHFFTSAQGGFLEEHLKSIYDPF